MDLVTGALGMLHSKLLELLKNEYKLQSGVKDQIRSLTPELESMQAVLRKIAKVPLDDLDEQAKLWARDVREASYDMEDILDTFLVHTYRHDGDDQSSLRRAVNYMGDRIHKLKANRDIAVGIREIKKQVLEVAARRARYRIGDNLVNPEAEKRVDPRLGVLFPEALQPVGIDEPRAALIEMLSVGKDDTSSKKCNTVAIVGSGGMGKTTLAKAVYDKVNRQFDYAAFVPVGSSPDPKKVLRDILIDLKNGDNRKNNNIDPQNCYAGADLPAILDERQLIIMIRHLLQEKRYFIVLDDIWDTLIWATVSKAFEESNHGSRIIVTSRNFEVSAKIGDVYEIRPLSDSDSRMLLYTRLTSGGKQKWPSNEEVVKKILQKCHGVPLAIITTAILLANTEINEWSNVYSSVGFGHEDDEQVNNTMKILSISYYDLPFHLKTCMLYLSTFPEDHLVDKNMLIWRWIAEGLVHTKDGKAVDFEVGESYFHELISKGMIIPVEDNWKILVGCRVHDMVLQMIRDIAREQNFSIVQDANMQVSQGKVRRLALHKDNAGLSQDNDSALPQLRSLSAIFCTMNMVSPVFRFKLLRVLALESCPAVEGYHRIEHIGKLLHLRYLGLSGTPIRQLPKEVGRLRFMQTLILIGTGVQELPASLVHLKKLMFLRADEKVRVPDWIGKLTSLVELEMYPADDDRCFVKELGKLRDLRVLKTRISLRDEEQRREFVQSLGNLQKIKFINMEQPKSFEFKDAVIEPSLVLHGNLHVLRLEAFMFPRLPASINPEELPNLYCLHLVLSELDQQDMEILGRFKKLFYLHLSAFKLLSSSIVIPGNGRFQNLKSFDALFYTPMFVQGAMPRLENIMLHIPVREVKIENPNLDFGFGHLSSLKNLIAGINCIGCLPAELEETEAAIRHAVNIHPNHPALLLHRAAEDGMATSNGFREKFERQVFRMGKLHERVGDQKKLHTAMRDEAFSIAVQLTDLNAKNKMQRYGEQIDASLDRVEHELEGDKDNYDLISRVSNDSAGMERALAIFTKGYMPLIAMLDDLTTGSSLQASVIEKLDVHTQKLNEQIDVQKNYNSTLYIHQAKEIARLVLEEHPSIAKIQPSSASIPEIAEILTSMVESSGSNRQMKHISRGNQVEHTGADSVMSIAISEPMLDIHAESSFAHSSTNRSDIRVLDLLNRRFSRVPSWINAQHLPDLCELQVVLSEDVDEKDIRLLGEFSELRKLVLVILRQHRLKLTICGCSGFQNLRSLDIAVPLRFQQGAMPRLEYINFAILVAEFKDANISLDFGLEYLSSLKTVSANIACDTASPREVEEVEAVIRHAVHVHPNHPALDMRRVNEDKMGPVDAGPRKFNRNNYKFWLNKEIETLNEQIKVQNNDNRALYNKAQEMAPSPIQDGHEANIAKIHGSSSAHKLEMVTLQKQLTAIESMDDVPFSYNQLLQDISRNNETEPSDGDETSFYLVQALSLNEQIDVQEESFKALFNKAQEMAHSIPERHPSIAKIKWTSESMLEIYILRKQMGATAEDEGYLSDPNKLMQFIKVQEQLLELYNNENKRMATIKEELEATLQEISDHVADAKEKGNQRRL